MIQTFKLKKGEISFESDNISILDDSTKQNFFKFLAPGIWTIYGTLSILRFTKTGDQFLLWTGLFIGIVNLIIFIVTLLQTIKSEIPYDDVKSIKLHQRFGSKCLIIRLRNNRFRRVSGIENAEEIEEYINSNLESRLHVG